MPDATVTCFIRCTDVTRDQGVYREVAITVDDQQIALLWYDEPAFKDESSIEIALQKLAIALGASVSCSKVDRDERTEHDDAIEAR